MSDETSDSLPVLYATRIADLEPPPYNDNTVRPLIDPPADVGAGIRSIENRLLITFERWTSLSAHDVFEYYMADRRFPVAWGEVGDNQVGQNRFQLSVPRELVPLGIVFPCFGLVRRIGSNTVSTSDEQTWFIKATRPGGVDQDPGEFYHSALILHLPADLSGPGAVLHPDRANEGVLITIEHYPEAFKGDTIELYWNGHLVTHVLSEAQADGLAPIEVFVPPEIILLPGGSGLVIIRFRVYDVVLNFSGELQQWSQAVRLESDLNPDLLEQPYFLVDGEDISDVNFDTQAESHFQIEVVVPTRLPNGSAIPTGAQILVTLPGTRFDGTEITVQLPPFAARPGRSATTDVSNSILKDLINGSMQITYQLQFPLGTVIGESRRSTVTIFGTVSTMPPVDIEEDEGGLIDPTVPYLKINFPVYTPYNPNFPVTLRMEAQQAGGGVVFYEQTQQAGAPPPPTRFRIVTAANFARFIGLGPVAVFYRVNDGVNTVLDAGVLTVRESEHRVVEIGERIADLPAPLIDGVDANGNIDPNDVIFQVDTTLPFTRFAPGDKVVWRWVGSGVGGSTGGEIDVVVAGQISFPVDREFIDLNNDGTIRFSYTLIRGSTTLRSEILEVTVGKAIGELPRPEVIEASRHPDELRPESATTGATIAISFLTMSPNDRIMAVWSGVPGIGTHEEIKNGNTSKTVHFDVPSDTVGANILPEGRLIEVQYFVLRGTRRIPSPTLFLQLLPLTTLPVPTIEGQDRPVLNISQLNGEERTLINLWAFIHQFQQMWLEYSGTYTDGASYFEATYSANLVTEEGARLGIMPPTPVDELRKLEDGSHLTISFWVSFDRSADRSQATLFRVREYIVQAVPGTLPHPVINGASGVGPDVTYDPLRNEHNVTVSVKYDGMTSRHRITLKWIFADSSEGERSLNGLDGGEVVFNLTSAGFLNYSVNTTIQLMYWVENPDFPDPIPSEVQTVRVDTIPIADLPAPRINNIEEGGVINLQNITGNPLASVAKWALSAKDQQVWMYCIAGENSLTVIDGDLIDTTQAANGLVGIAVLRSWFAALADNTRIRVVFRVAFSGANKESQIVNFPETNYVVRTLPAIGLDTSTMFVDLGGWILEGFGFTDVAYTGNIGRGASGGVGALTFSSSNTSVAIVDNANRGRLTFTGPGITTITVRDQANQSKSYNIQVTGSGRRCRYVGVGDWNYMNSVIASTGGIMLRYDTASSLRGRFSNRFPRSEEVWVNEGIPPISPSSHYTVNVATGGGLPPYLNWGTGQFPGYAII
ncbi:MULTISPECIES: Ig-like domain-containing protein [unclassified Pseudomonas]|uniref:Ig-like domain-containing protein n=1 Tax=unclassified Pseudomonas TaxID=196821 RepID=UPI002117386C|nr:MULTISPECIES: Ig-like domain-containing protein [unclassified Pseudomonas]